LACRNAHVRFSNGFSAVGPEIGIEEDRMKLKKTCRAVTLATALATGSVSAAAAQDWHYAASIYAFMPETNTTIGTLNHGPIESTLSFSDALDNLDFTFMGTLEASNDRWSVIGDFLLFDLSFGNPTPGTNVSQVNTAIKAQMFNGYLAYRVYDDPGLEVDLAAGFRWFDVSSGIDLLQGSTVVGSSSADENWVDPLVAVRARVQLSEKWFGTGLIDYGGFSSDSETWQVLLTVGYQINDQWSVGGGYRYIDVEHDINGRSFAFDQSGPIIGATFRF
jgi:opacity protein-like surface antigen